MNAEKYLDYLNKEYFKIHKTYEDLFWLAYMGDKSAAKKKNVALIALDGFRNNSKHVEKLKSFQKKSNIKTKNRIKIWLDFFDRFQTPEEARPVKERIATIESQILKNRATRREGYIDPHTKKFITASSNKMSALISTHDDEKVRKACFEAKQKLALGNLDLYIKLVAARNQYARILGYEDFYDFKLRRNDNMTKKELFGIFDSIYEKTKYANKNIRKLEKKMPGLRKPWNFGYMMAGDFIKEEDPYFQFEEALERWGRSFASLGIDFKGSSIQLDLLDRKGKHNNGFCHWPDPVRFNKSKRIPGSSNFTCNVVMGQIGSGELGYNTLFHEGGHAAHFLNNEQREIILNTEHPPMTAAWAETHSMFLDTVYSSVEWGSRYAKNSEGEPYPFDLYKRNLTKTYPIRPLDLNGIIFVANFEKEIYEAKNLDRKKVISIAKNNFKKYFDRSEDSLWALNVSHIYAWDSTANYHGYGLATLALHQWREYFFNKYGYIVDNPRVGEEMKKVWQLGAAYSFGKFVKIATGKKLSPDAYLKEVNLPLNKLIQRAEERIKRLQNVKPHKGKINLNAKIRMVHGKKEIANNNISFEDMTAKYKAWLQKQTELNKKRG